MSLSFLHPALAWGLLAALVPLAVHLFFRRRPRPTPFPAIELILRARRETQRRMRLRKLLLFAARTLLIAAIAAALARPKLERPGEAAAAVQRGAAATALVLDASASMGYRLGGGRLFDRARADLLAALDGLGTDEPATAIVCGGPAAPVALAPSFDRGAVRSTLSDAALTAGHADLTACVAAAARALSQGTAGAQLGKRIAVATDLTASAWRLDVPAPRVQGSAGPVRPEVTLLDAARGAALPNLAVTELTAEPDAAVGPRGYRVTATVARFGSPAGKGEASEVELQLHAGGPEAPVVIRAFARVPLGGAVKKTLSWKFPQGGPAALSVTLAPDALELDDARVLTLAVPRDVKALVVNGAPSPVKVRDAAFFVEAALSSPASPVRATLVDAESLDRVRFADFDVVFLLDVRTVGAKSGELARFVEGGGGLFFSMGDEIDPDRYDAELGALLPRPLHVVKTAGRRGATGAGAAGGMAGDGGGAARFADVDWAHPALQVFTGTAREGFDGAKTWRYMLLKPRTGGGGDRVLASFDDGAPALVEARRGAGRVMLFTSTLDRSWSDWSIRTSFLPAVQRLAAWLSGALEERRDAPTLVNAPRSIVANEGTKLVAVVPPGGRELPASALSQAPGSGAPPSLVPDRPGLWGVKVEERGQTKLDPRLAFAVLPDPRESDTARLDPAELTAWFGGESVARVAGEGAATPRAIPLWSMLLALGMLAFLGEGLLLR